MLHIDLYRDPQTIAELRSRWAQSAKDSRTFVPGATVEWYEHYLHTRGPEVQPWLLEVKAAEETLGFLPLVQTTITSRFGDLRLLKPAMSSAMRNVAASGRQSALVWMGAMRFLRSQAALWDVLDIRGLDPTGPDSTRAANAFRLSALRYFDRPDHLRREWDLTSFDVSSNSHLRIVATTDEFPRGRPLGPRLYVADDQIPQPQRSSPSKSLVAATQSLCHDDRTVDSSILAEIIATNVNGRGYVAYDRSGAPLAAVWGILHDQLLEVAVGLVPKTGSAVAVADIRVAIFARMAEDGIHTVRTNAPSTLLDGCETREFSSRRYTAFSTSGARSRLCGLNFAGKQWAGKQWWNPRERHTPKRAEALAPASTK